MNEKILIVDDETNFLNAVRRQLHGRYDLDFAKSGFEGLQLAREKGPYAVVVSDLRMPQMDGIKFLGLIRDVCSDTVRIMITGDADVSAAVASVNEGNVFRFLIKPVEMRILIQTLDASIQQYRLTTSERELLQDTLRESVKVLIDVLALASPATFGRALRITRYVNHVVSQLMLPNPWQFELAAMLSQIGCVTIPWDIVYNKFMGKELQDEDLKMFNSHPAIGYQLLGSIPRMASTAEMISRQMDPYRNQNSAPRADVVALGAQILHAAVDFEFLLACGKSHSECIEIMKSRENEYNPIILSALAVPMEIPSDMEVKTIHYEQLEPEMIMAKSIRTRTGRLLIAEGQEITLPLIHLIECWCVRGEIDPEICVLQPGRKNR